MWDLVSRQVPCGGSREQRLLEGVTRAGCQNSAVSPWSVLLISAGALKYRREFKHRFGGASCLPGGSGGMLVTTLCSAWPCYCASLQLPSISQ